MVDIMSHLHQYVPTVTYMDNISISDEEESVLQVPHAIFHKILFGGDQLTAARARGAQKIRMNSISPKTRLEGLIPCTEDWHTKLNLLGVNYVHKIVKTLLILTNFCRLFGSIFTRLSLLQSMEHFINFASGTNVVSDPAKDFNACDDFIMLIVTCHILTASLKVLDMTSLNDTPLLSLLQSEFDTEPQNLWMLTDSERKEVLKRITEKIVDRFISFQFHTNVHKCTDDVHEYSKQLLGLGCFYMEYSDAIREGDGDRVLRCWWYLLAIFKSSGRKNYSIEALNMLYQYKYQLTPRQSAELLWSRFINVHGLRGRNIPFDLHLEHLNCMCKYAISNLGVNKTETAIKRVGNALGTLSPVLQQFDLQTIVFHICAVLTMYQNQKKTGTA